MFKHLLQQIATDLEALGIPYMVIGGQAVLFYGEPRVTRDIDVTLGVGIERLGEMLKLAESRKWKVLVDNPAAFVQKTMILPCVEPATGFRIDFIFSFSPYERQAIERATRAPIGERSVSFASVEDVILQKIVAGRPRDLEDVRNILSKQKSVDLKYVRSWLLEFERGIGGNFIERFEQIWKERRDSN